MNNDKAQELTAKITESINALYAETDAAKQSAIYRAWLSTLSRFHSYSWANCLLIWTQAPEATRVAGFNTWKSLGRFVKKGQTGIRILAPLIRKVEEEKKNGTTERVSRPFGFKTVAVFDYAQTDGPAKWMPWNYREPLSRAVNLPIPLRVMMNPAWPKRILCGHRQGAS
jgi:hypothetical protein